MKTKTIVREAAVLLFAALMVCSSVTVLANTTISSTPAKTTNHERGKALVWDNTVGVSGYLGGIIVATVRTEGNAQPADDFILDTSQTVTSIFWEGGYFQCQLATGQHDYNWDWRIIFREDDGTGNQPAGWSDLIYNQTIPDANIARTFWYNFTNPNGNTYWVAHYSADLPVPITFDAGKKYWITIQGLQDGNAYPQACWARHNNTAGGIKLHEAEILASYWGYSVWTNISVLVTDHLPHDLNFQLFGGAPDTEPPYTTCTLTGDMSGSNYLPPVTVTLTAHDNDSGVASTKYKIDAGGWTTYSGPFDVSALGDHTVTFYSTDNAGNKEGNKTASFTIISPIDISVKGGFGITATIKNIGKATLTNISWKIELTGGLILVGKSKTGTITSLAPAGTAPAKDMVFGFGKPTIMVTAGDASKTVTGTVILFFVLGVK